MTPLLVICALCALGIAFALSAWRWLLRQSPRYDEGGQLAQGVNRETSRYLRRQSVLVFSLAAVLGALILLGYGVAFQLGIGTSADVRETGLWLTGAYFVGVLSALSTTWVLAHSAAAATGRVVAEARRSLDRAVQVGLRAGAVPGMVCISSAVLGFVVLCALRSLVAGTFDGGAAASLAVTMGAPCLLAGFALGYCFVALLVQLSGGVLATVAKVGGDVAFLAELDRGSETVPRPGLMAGLVGDQVGASPAGLLGLSTAAVGSILASMMMAAHVYRANEGLPSSVAWVLLPLVSAGFGLLASWFGVLVVRTDDTEVPMNAVGRGMYVASAVYVVAAAGSTKWLLDSHWLEFAGTMAIGAFATLTCFWLSQYYTDHKFRPVRDLAKVAAVGPAFATLRGAFTAAGSVSVVAGLVGLGGLASFLLGEQSTLASGGVLGIALMVVGMLGAAPYVLAMTALAHHADRAGGIIESTLGADRPDVVARARVLDALGTTVKSFGRQLSAAAGTLTSLVLARVFLQDTAGLADRPGEGVAYLMLVVGAAAGLLLVLAFVRIAIRVVLAAGRDLAHELHSAGGSEGPHAVETRAVAVGVKADPSDGRAGDASAEMVSRVSLRGVLLPLFVGVGLPLCVAVGLRIAASGDRVARSAEALVALLLVATIVGATTSLFLSSAGGIWDNAKKYIETGAHGGRTIPNANLLAHEEASGAVTNPTYAAAIVADTVGTPLAGLVAPTLQTLLATLYALALVFLPFFR